MTEVSIKTHKITIDPAEAMVEYETGDFVEFNGVIVVRIDIPTGEVTNRNVVGVDETGTECWRIPESPRDSTDNKPYPHLNLHDGTLWVGNRKGWTYRPDPATGELLAHKFTK